MTENASLEKSDIEYTVKISTDLNDPVWDQFLQDIEAGHHVQSSLWAQLKNMHHWHVLRITLWHDDEIIGGAQILVKSLSIFGKVGYVPQGPILKTFNDYTCKSMMQAIDDAMKNAGVRALFILPPRNGALIESYLQEKGYHPQSLRIGPDATTMVDLYQDLDTIQKNMKSKTRYNIRYAERKGIVVREGTPDELPIFHELLQKTAERNEFSPYSLEYFERMYDLFYPHGHFRLLFAEHEGQIVSTILLIAFGDTVIYKKGGWSGEKGNLRPNEALHWDAICWAKEQGYHYYDLEGISRDAAIAFQDGDGIPDESMNTYTRFKLGFRGEVLALPQTYMYSRNPMINWVSGQRKMIDQFMELVKFIQRL